MACKSTRKRNKCNEECLDRIAARLYSLDAIFNSNVASEIIECIDGCCEEKAADAASAVLDDCCGADQPSDSCCSKTSTIEKDEGCCSGTKIEADSCCDSGKIAEPTSGCCAPDMKPAGNCGEDKTVGGYSSSTEKANKVTSGCCAPVVKPSKGCCSEKQTDSRCSSTKQSEGLAAGSYASTTSPANGCGSDDKNKTIDDCCAAKKPAESKSGCCVPKTKPSDDCCGDKTGTGCSAIQQANTVSTGCCASTVSQDKESCTGSKSANDGSPDKAVDSPPSECCTAPLKHDEGCCSNKLTTDDRCSSGNTVVKASGGCKSTVKSSCSTPEKSCSDTLPRNSGCCSKSAVVSTQFIRDCNDPCCDDTVQDQASNQSARVDNFQTTMDRLEAMLKKGQCLCRRVQEQWGFNCCDPASAPAGVVVRKRRASPAPSTQSRTVKEKATAISTATAIHPRCSFDAPDVAKNRRKDATLKSPSDAQDVERGSAREHVVLDVSGMTCTGCSKKMMNVLNGITGLSNAQVTFVSGNAEFDLDPEIAGKAEDVLLRVEKETGFKCSRLVSGFQELHVLMSSTAAKEMVDALPPGVMSVVKDKKKKDNYFITYNPRVVGARSVLPPTANLAPPQDSVGIAEGKRRLISTALSTTLAAVLTIPVVVLEWSNNPLPSKAVGTVALILGTGVQAIAVPEFYVGAIKSLVYSHVIEMDMLVVISITSAYFYSVIAFGLQRARVNLEQGPFFETSTLLITLVLLGRLMAAWARMKALSSVSLRSLQAETALLIEASGETSKIDARLLQFGDPIVIPPHSRVVTDGVVTEGASEVDESMVTGESLPVAKQSGDALIAGTINGSGTLRVRLTRLPGENSITDIANLVENAVAAKPRVQDLADRVASYFIPAVVGIAIIVFCIWIAIAIEIRNRNGGGAVGLAITYAIAVLAISCPCALGLAVPMVLVIAGGVAARAGVVIKAADAIERSYKVTDVVFDKTGTLTEGNLQVVHTQAIASTVVTEEQIMLLGRAMVEGNEHPVSIAVASHLDVREKVQASKPLLGTITSIPGAGIEAQYQGYLIKAGNPYWLNLEHHQAIAGLLSQAMTIFCITFNNEPILVLGLKSTLRFNAAAIIADLHRRNITTHIVSGDNPAAVQDIARTVGVENSNIRSRSSPSQKQEYVHTLQSTPGQKRTVLFIGDGTNDAVAIAQSDIGVQMGSASDVTGAVSDVVILSRDLSGLITLLELSRRAVRRIQFNFVWSGVYNLFAILLAAGAFVRVRIEPAYAGLGEIVSVGPVILAAVSLMWKLK